jgi:hypothetical protein
MLDHLRATVWHKIRRYEVDGFLIDSRTSALFTSHAGKWLSMGKPRVPSEQNIATMCLWPATRVMNHTCLVYVNSISI